MIEIIRYVQQQVRDLYKKANVQPPRYRQAGSVVYTAGDQLMVEQEIGAQSNCASSESRLNRKHASEMSIAAMADMWRAAGWSLRFWDGLALGALIHC